MAGGALPSFRSKIWLKAGRCPLHYV